MKSESVWFVSFLSSERYNGLRPSPLGVFSVPSPLSTQVVLCELLLPSDTTPANWMTGPLWGPPEERTTDPSLQDIWSPSPFRILSKKRGAGSVPVPPRHGLGSLLSFQSVRQRRCEKGHPGLSPPDHGSESTRRRVPLSVTFHYDRCRTGRRSSLHPTTLPYPRTGPNQSTTSSRHNLSKITKSYGVHGVPRVCSPPRP